MRTLALSIAVAAIVIASAMPSALALVTAQTWDSHSGLASNPCSQQRDTFANALSVTASGGVITRLDSGDFGNGGTLTITQSVTIDYSGQVGLLLRAATSAQSPSTAPAPW
jgi:hypothetical protein